MKTPQYLLLLALLGMPTVAQNGPKLMTPNQLRAYLDEVEAKLPTWDSGLMALFAPVPAYRGENRDLVALRDSAFGGCREFVSETVNTDIPTMIKAERIAPRLSLEIRLHSALNGIHDCVSGTSPFIGDSRPPGRGDTALKLTQEINPLLLPLAKHILAEAESLESRKCANPSDTPK